MSRGSSGGLATSSWCKPGSCGLRRTSSPESARKKVHSGAGSPPHSRPHHFPAHLGTVPRNVKSYSCGRESNPELPHKARRMASGNFTIKPPHAQMDAPLRVTTLRHPATFIIRLIQLLF